MIFLPEKQNQKSLFEKEKTMRKACKGEVDIVPVIYIGAIVVLVILFFWALDREKKITYISGVLENAEVVKEEKGWLRNYYYVKLEFRGRPLTPTLKVTEKPKVGEAYSISFSDPESVDITHINRYRPGK